jgi:putative hydrolase of HD superfamily
MAVEAIVVVRTSASERAMFIGGVRVGGVRNLSCGGHGRRTFGFMETTNITDRLERQLAFIVEADRLKSVIRQTTLCDSSRRENSAEHSWHLALMVAVLAEYANEDVNPMHVMRMLIVHDLVEIDAGDTFAYDVAGNVGRVEREQRAADRIFGLLPEDQSADLRVLWNEFEAQTTQDARFAAAIDRMEPLLSNHHSGGGSWRAHRVTREQVLERMRPIETAAPGLWPAVVDIVGRNVASGAIS